jgi:hypothetical protein
MVAAPGPAMKLDKSTIFNPKNMLPSVISSPSSRLPPAAASFV